MKSSELKRKVDTNSENFSKFVKLDEQPEHTGSSPKDEVIDSENNNSTPDNMVVEGLQENEHTTATQAIDSLIQEGKVFQFDFFKNYRLLILNDEGHVLTVGLNSVDNLSDTFLAYAPDKTIPSEKMYTHAYAVFNCKDLKTNQDLQLVVMRPFLQSATMHSTLEEWLLIKRIKNYFNEHGIKVNPEICFSGECKSLLSSAEVLQMIDQPLGTGITFNTKGTKTDKFKPVALMRAKGPNKDIKGEVKIEELVKQYELEKPSSPRIPTNVPKYCYDLDTTYWDKGVKLDSPSRRRKFRFFTSSEEQINNAKNKQPAQEQDKSRDNESQNQEVNNNNSILS
ncbi:Uncharacterised protein [Legionella beliardensis]|uniref:Uncharacterized protein n=1 Tax=Legionella beliardensis TaxID=91822 RepID=A0A378I3S6_9GAMM|nr:hypothetical protein [Legionella beliardensis]STX29512.1 Uncharacterised protein [Legionella beliardensis]